MRNANTKHDAVVLELIVNNHAGVMSHVTGLFARRCFNLEGILCGPTADGSHSRMCLLVHERPRLGQLMKQLEKLHDVLHVAQRNDIDPAVFHNLP